MGTKIFFFENYDKTNYIVFEIARISSLFWWYFNKLNKTAFCWCKTLCKISPCASYETKQMYKTIIYLLQHYLISYDHAKNCKHFFSSIFFIIIIILLTNYEWGTTDRMGTLLQCYLLTSTGAPFVKTRDSQAPLIIRRSRGFESHRQHGIFKQVINLEFEYRYIECAIQKYENLLTYLAALYFLNSMVILQ